MSKSHALEWIAPENARLPDFIICGAMKCRTSTVHTILNKHPNIFIPESEVNFFDMDDLFLHSDFYIQGEEYWRWPNITNAPQDYWNWYQSFFENASEGCLLGEDSTCYLASPKAAYRISLQSKSIKTIICLRQPTRRAYSQYWHMLRTGRALFNFEDSIKFTPHYVLKQSMYMNQVIEFMRYIPRERIFFFVLEDFLCNRERVINDLASFLSLDYDHFTEGALNTHSNNATFPTSIKFQTFKNRILRSFGNIHYRDRLPFSTEITNKANLFAVAFNKLHNKMNPLKQQPTPKMNLATKKFLDQYFQRELKGLGDLIGINIDQLWFKDDTDSQL